MIAMSVMGVVPADGVGWPRSFRLVGILTLWLLGAIAPIAAAATARADEGPVSLAMVEAEAERRAQVPYVPMRQINDPDWLALNYEDFIQIRFRDDQSIWHDRNHFELELFHPGHYFPELVQLFIVRAGRARPIDYDRQLFDYGDLAPRLSTLPDPGGYAGFRVIYPLNLTSTDRASRKDEVIAFLGASYFRLLGRGQVYGLSARGVAVDTASEQPEEFPDFVAFWIEEPEADATELTIFALLDGPSLAGAYRFVLYPGAMTELAVTAVLFPRLDIGKLGIAPLTSMYWYGENTPRYRFGTFERRQADDYRPEIHDSDGLMILSGSGEWLWRPLINHRRLRVSAYRADGVRGFGLIQRDRDFDHYQDLDFRYERRPSFWVMPEGDWGPGHVELLEIPTDRETTDNIGAYWRPAEPVRAGDRLELRYRLVSYLANPAWPPGGFAVATRVGGPGAPGSEAREAGGQRFVVDFAGGELPYLIGDQPVEAVVGTSSGQVQDISVRKNDVTGGWRLAFTFMPSGAAEAELRAALKLREHYLTETWTYSWTVPWP